MLNRIIAFSIRNKLLIGLFTIGLIAYGIYQFKKLPIDAVPDITDNQVLVITSAPAYGALDIERLITFPIEQVNANIPGLTEIRSFSRFGLSLVTIIFDDATDVYWARQQVSERLLQVQPLLPQGMGSPELGPVSTGLGEIYQYVVRPVAGFEHKYDAIELRTIQDWIIRRQLIGVKGVAEVSSFGGKLKQFHIEIDPHKLEALGISINDVFEALEQNNQNTGGSYIEKGPAVIFINTEGLINSIADIEQIRVNPTASGTPLFIKDIAEIKIGFAKRFGAIQYNDEGEVAGAVVMMLKGANSNEVIKNIKNRIAEIQKTLPEGVIIEPFLDRTKMVNNAISTVNTNLIEGALIVVFILVIFLGNLRAGLLVASVIPLSLLFAVIMMNTFGVSGNLMSLGALDFGLIVDGAIIIVEAVMYNLHHHQGTPLRILSQVEMNSEVNKAASKMMNSAVFGQMVILIVYIPIFSLQGIEGKMFKPMAQTVTFSLIGAFILSLTYIPMMSSLVLSKTLGGSLTLADRIMHRLENFYSLSLNFLLHFPKIILMITSFVFLFALLILSRLGGEFIPALEEGDFAVDTRVLTGSNIQTTLDYTGKAAGLLKRTYPEVEKIVTKIGAGEVPTDPMPMEASDMMIILKDKKEWTSAKTFDELATKMGNTLSQIPGITYGFQYPVQMRFNELMTGAKQDVVCKIFGENLDTLSFYANKLGEIIKTVEGATDIAVEPISGRPQILISYNRSTIAQYGLTIEMINKIINMAFAGQVAGQLYEGERRFDILVKAQNQSPNELSNVEHILVKTPSGQQIPITQFANIHLIHGPNQIQREDAKRRITVAFNVEGRDVQSIVHELQDKADAQVVLPSGYYVHYGGAFENIEAAKRRLVIAVPVALLLIFILLYFAFNSIKQGILIYTAIPLSAIGGIFFLAWRDMPFSISASIGFIALFGVAVLNGIVLITEFNRLRVQNNMDLKQVILKGSRNRLRPVLMTASVASLGFLPMAISNGSGAEVQRPLATVVIGGLIAATFLTLIILPILYIMFEKIKPNTKLKTVVVTLFIAIALNGNAQTKMNIDQVIGRVLSQNLDLAQRELESKYQNQLIKTVAGIPPSAITLNYGQINSAYKDNLVSLSQGFNHPQYTKSYKLWMNEQWKSATINKESKKAELIKLSFENFYALIHYNEKIKILNELDSILKITERQQQTRLQAGEINKIQLLSSSSQLLQLQILKMDLTREINNTEIKLHILLNEEVNILPEYTSIKMTLPQSSYNTKNVENHPLLVYSRQKQNEGLAHIKFEQAQLLPAFQAGINSMTMKGTGANDRVYDKWTRFNSVQFGLGIPIIKSSHKAKIEASKMNLGIINNAITIEKTLLENELEASYREHGKLIEIIHFFEDTALPNSDLMIKLSGDQLKSGEISGLEWSYLISQSYNLKLDYLDKIHHLNKVIIHINYLNTQL